MKMINKIISNRYLLISRIGEGGMSDVYLADDLTDPGNKRAVKILRKKRTTNRIQDIIRFRSEATIVSKLSHPNIIKIYEIGELNGLHYIVTEFINGSSLSDHFKDNTPFTIAEAADIVTQACRALEHIHINRVVHRDLKPGNIMVSQQTDGGYMVKLIDFGLAQIREFNEIKEPDEIAGTFCYMSPEQCGVIRQSVDERSDLYSLGIIFYQLLSGQLPFRGETVGALMHQHIANIPKPPTTHNSAIPEILDRIILKLLEKEPSKRYQSAGGLLSDLVKYQKGKTDFVIGRDDASIKLNYRTNLVGRDTEFNKLKELFDNAVNGSGSVCLISGEAGLGKTRLVEELLDYIYARGGLFINGTCFSGENKTPYGPFREALNRYIQIFNKYAPDKQRIIKERIKESVGELGAIIVKLNPQMNEILGEYPPLVELEPDRENKRFLMVVVQFFLNLGKIENCLTLMLDDLQWADHGSLELLNELIYDIAKFPVAVIGTSRSNEILREHGLNELFTAARDYDYPLTIIKLGHFDRQRINSFVAGLLYEEDENTNEIADFIFQKSKGNPFFAIEILKDLVEDGIIARNNKKWSIDHKILQHIEISLSIIDILLRRISQLNARETNVLSYAAVIGRKFEIEFLFALLPEFDTREVVEIVDKAIQLHLLEVDIQEEGKILFAHDRIREAFNKNIDGEEKKKLHREIAQKLEAIHNENTEQVIYDLAYHYIQAGDMKKTLKYSIPAGEKAKESYANDEAVRYFTIAKKILEEWDRRGDDEWLVCAQGIGQIYLVIGNYDEAIELFTALLSVVSTTMEKSNIYKQIAEAYLKKGDFQNCEEYSRKGLILFGERLTVNRVKVVISIINELLIHILHNIFYKLFKLKKENHKDEKYKAIILFYKTLVWCYILSDIVKCIRLILRSLNISERHIGPSKELGFCTGGYASLFMQIPLFKKSIYYHEKALALRQEYNDEWGVAQQLQVMGFCNKWKGDYLQAIEYFNRSVDLFKKIGDIREYALVKAGICEANMYISNYDIAKKAVDEYLQISQKTKDNYGISASYNCSVPYYIETGNYEKAYECGIKSYDLAYENKIWFVFCEVNIHLGILFLEQNAIEKSLGYLKTAKELYEKNNFLKHYTIPLYPFIAEAYLAEYLQKKENMPKAEKRASLKKIKKSCMEAMRKTRPWVTYYGISKRTAAKYYAETGRNLKAEKLFQESVDLHKKLGRNYELAKSLYEYSLFIDRLGDERSAKGKLESAYRIFKEIDSKVYLRRTADLLGIEETDSTPTERLMDRQRLASIITVSQDISSILNVDSLLDGIMGKAVEVTGAKQGYLFLHNDETNDLEIRATKGVENVAMAEYSKHVVHEVYQKGDKIISVNAEGDKGLTEYASVVEYGLKSILCVPIKHHERVLGVCYLDNPLARGVFSSEDADMLGVFMNQASIAIENAYLYKNLEIKVEERTQRLKERTGELEMMTNELSEAYQKLNDAYAKMKDDLMLARNVQKSILPGNNEKLGNLHFYAEYMPLIEVGGDIYDVFTRNDGNIRIFLADATGHGIVASLVTMLIKSEYEKLKNIVDDPHDLFESLNGAFFKYRSLIEIFFTGIIVDIDTGRERLRYASAGHPKQLVIKENHVIELPNTGRPVAKWKGTRCRSVDLEFKTGDKLLLFTDGIYEEFNSQREMYGEERMKSIVQKFAGEPVKEIINALIKNLMVFVGSKEFHDDIVIIGVE
jgi:serine/threonine protein kinase/serine phosphatase RsbU (regulator of sigma subunit)